MTESSDSKKAGSSHQGHTEPEFAHATFGNETTIKEYIERHEPRRWTGRLSGDESRSR